MRLGRWAALLVFGLLLAGCGSGGADGTTATPSTDPGTSVKLAAPRVSGPHGPQRFAGAAGKRQFQSLAGMVCQTVRAGAPVPPPPTRSASALRGYARAAAKANQRTVVSLERLGAPASLRAPLEHLVASLRQLQLTYAGASAAHGHAGKAAVATMARSVAIAEAQAAAAAQASGTPTCAPRPALPGAAPSPARQHRAAGSG
jgi:hypothetical protein